MTTKELELIENLLEQKKQEMIMFLNLYMNDKTRHNIGEDIIRLMPNPGDIAMLQMGNKTND